MNLTHFSLCTGIGGIDLAAEWTGFETIGQCEIDDYASRVLAKNFKGVPNFHDIRTVTASRLRENGIEPESITVLSAGFPCQPYSLAGKGKGDGDERDLWGEVARCIRDLKPKWFVGENTPGLFARANQRYFKRILADLTEMGYRVSWGIWGACDVGAPHKRERVFICAHRNADGEHDEAQSEIYEKNPATCGVCGKVSHADSFATCGLSCGKKRAYSEFGKLCEYVSDSDGMRQLQQKRREQDERQQTCNSRKNVSYTYGAREKERRKKSNGIERCFGDWQTEPDVGRVANGISARVDKLRCLGNAVVPQQIYPLFEAIAEYEKGESNG